MFPTTRLRRLRHHPVVRDLVRETTLSVSDLILPLFVRPGRNLRRPINAMPGVFQLSPDELVREAARAHELGVPAVLLFGIPDSKDDKASGAYAANGIVQRATRALKIVPGAAVSPIFSAMRKLPSGVFILPSSVPIPNRELEMG